MSILEKFRFTKSELELLKEKHKDDEETKSHCRGCYHGNCEQCKYGWIPSVSDEDYIRGRWLEFARNKVNNMDEYIQLKNNEKELEKACNEAREKRKKFWDDEVSKFMIEREKQHLKELLEEMGE